MYRSYRYDRETGFYYLQSRYYNPEWGRFLNADSTTFDTGADLIGHNMYLYCANNPINNIDVMGEELSVIGAMIIVFAVILVIQAVTSIPQETLDATGEIIDDAISTVADTAKGAVEGIQTIVNDKVLTKTESKVTTTVVTQAKQREKKAEIHHIVAQKAKAAAPARAILDELDININSSNNLVALDYNLHRHIHTSRYYSWVNTNIMNAYNSAMGNKQQQIENVINTLDSLRNKILAGNAIF